MIYTAHPLNFLLKNFFQADFILIMKTHAKSKYFNMEIFCKHINI